MRTPAFHRSTGALGMALQLSDSVEGQATAVYPPPRAVFVKMRSVSRPLAGDPAADRLHAVLWRAVPRHWNLQAPAAICGPGLVRPGCRAALGALRVASFCR
jgi:hypothetical protein